MPIPAHAADASPPSTPLASSVETPAPVAAPVQAAPVQPAVAPVAAPERAPSVWEQAEALARATQPYAQPPQAAPSHALQPYQPAPPAGYSAPGQYPPWAAPAPAPAPVPIAVPGYPPYAASPYAAPYQPPSTQTYEEREREQALHKHVKEIKTKVNDIATKLEVGSLFSSLQSSLKFSFRLFPHSQLPPSQTTQLTSRPLPS